MSHDDLEADRIRPVGPRLVSPPSRPSTDTPGGSTAAATGPRRAGAGRDDASSDVPDDGGVHDLPVETRRAPAFDVSGLPEFEVTLTGASHGGEAVGRHEGIVTFVAGALPGEVATVRITGRRPAWIRGIATGITGDSPDRTSPACEHFGRCGGCHWQHASDAAQLAIKSQVLRDQLTRLGGVVDPSIAPPVPSPNPRNYRTTIQLVPGTGPRGARTLNFQAAAVPFGPYAGDDPATAGHGANLHAIEACPIAVPDINRAIAALPWDAVPLLTWQRLEGIVIRYAPPVAGMSSVVSRLRELAPKPVRGRTTPPGPVRDEQGVAHGIQVTFVCRAPVARADLRPFVQAAPVAVPDLAGVLVARNRGHHGTLLWGAPALAYEVGEDLLAVPAGAFFQVNVPAATLLIDRVREWLAPTASSQVIDAYAGVGLFSVSLAPHVGAVVAIESDDAAATGAYHNVTTLGRTNINVLHESVEDALPRLARGEAVVDRLLILDPPRKGVEEAVIEAIGLLAPVRIAYVSCEPATLARDVRRLAAHGYRVVRTGVIDLFPQTYHVESVTILERVSDG